MLGEYIFSATLMPLVKPDEGICPIDFGVGISGGGEGILHVTNRLIKNRGDDVRLLMLLVDFKNSFNLVDQEVMLQEVYLRCPDISRWAKFCYFSSARLYHKEHTSWSYQGVQQGDPPWTFVIFLSVTSIKIYGEGLELIVEDGPRRGLHINVDKTMVFGQNEDPRS
nr:hypothetical protein [Tanacetum cinerariifolium]